MLPPAVPSRKIDVSLAGSGKRPNALTQISAGSNSHRYVSWAALSAS
jgi:hypothetical protein